jgi:hypothetical protein
MFNKYRILLKWAELTVREAYNSKPSELQANSPKPKRPDTGLGSQAGG